MSVLCCIVILGVIMLGIAMHADHHYAKNQYAGRHYAECQTVFNINKLILLCLVSSCWVFCLSVC
jgi:hypothetical protein